jgi:hypothetical protein
MALKGNLKDFSPTQLLNLVSVAKRTGTLSIRRSGGENAELAFNKGKLVAATLGSGDGSLASILAGAGILKPKQAEAIRDRGKKTGDKQLGLLLINAGYVTQADIIQSIKQYVLKAVYEFTAWPEGAFLFETDVLPSDDRITVPVDLENVIIEAARRHRDIQQMIEEIPNLDMALKFPDNPDAKLKRVNLSPEEWRVISYVKPTNTIRMIAKANKMNDEQIRRIVYGLREAGLVEIVRAQGERPVVQPTFSSSLIRRIISTVQEL